jgi:hypothetical protein
MHRSRPFVLVIVVAAAACSKHDPAEGSDILSQDRTLVAGLGTSKDARRPSVPDACGAVTVAAAPSPADQQRAEELTQQAGVAELHGDIEDARLLLRRAATLDGTNKSAAYHLGRTSEALGDRDAAMTAYCHYLALAPTTAESVEARQRVARLSRAPSPVRTPVVTTARSRRAVPSRPRARVTEPPTVTTNGDVVATQASVPATTPDPAPVTDPLPAPAPPRTPRRGSIGAQGTIIGAAAGAILGAATGRSVKSTVIGAAAGGVLGTVVGAATRPAGRGAGS